MLTQGGEGMDIILENGDRVVVPELPTFKEEKLVTNRVYVLGEVGIPGLIEVKTDITVLEAISKAGGVKLTAAKGKSRIVRGDIYNPEVIPLDLKKLIDKSDLSLNVKLQNGDVIYVPTTFLGKFSNSFNQIIPILNAFTYPAIYRDLYTTGGIGILDTGARPTGGAAEEGGAGVSSETLLSR
jgi:polysaccharide export outer membrane protein